MCESQRGFWVSQKVGRHPVRSEEEHIVADDKVGEHPVQHEGVSTGWIRIAHFLQLGTSGDLALEERFPFSELALEVETIYGGALNDSARER